MYSENEYKTAACSSTVAVNNVYLYSCIPVVMLVNTWNGKSNKSRKQVGQLSDHCQSMMSGIRTLDTKCSEFLASHWISSVMLLLWKTGTCRSVWWIFIHLSHVSLCLSLSTFKPPSKQAELRMQMALKAAGSIQIPQSLSWRTGPSCHKYTSTWFY